LTITGYDRDTDEFVSYLDIRTITIDEETGPDPIKYHYRHFLGYWGFSCIVDGSSYIPIYGIPVIENENFIKVFFVWDSNEKKYIEKRFPEE
jgi:hypothetical protein